MPINTALGLSPYRCGQRRLPSGIRECGRVSVASFLLGGELLTQGTIERVEYLSLLCRTDDFPDGRNVPGVCGILDFPRIWTVAGRQSLTPVGGQASARTVAREIPITFPSVITQLRGAAGDNLGRRRSWSEQVPLRRGVPVPSTDSAARKTLGNPIPRRVGCHPCRRHRSARVCSIRSQAKSRRADRLACNVFRQFSSRKEMVT